MELQPAIGLWRWIAAHSAQSKTLGNMQAFQAALPAAAA
jgi:hypothetical protein